MKTLLPFLTLFIICLVHSCTKDSQDPNTDSGVVKLETTKSGSPMDGDCKIGTIRGYFNGVYHELNQQIEKVQPVDSFSNVYFYSDPENDINQINLIRSDSTFFIAIFILGYPLDSMPDSLPVTPEYCKFAEIQFSSLPGFDWGKPNHFVDDDFYGQTVFITDRKDDVLTGNFSAILHDCLGNTLEITDGEFKIQIVRKYMPVEQKSF